MSGMPTKTAKSTNCQKCPLALERTNIVEGSGVVNAPLMVVGEAPGREEDESGISFVGDSGVLLRTTLAQFGVTTTRLFTTNVVRCQPKSVVCRKCGIHRYAERASRNRQSTEHPQPELPVCSLRDNVHTD